MKSRTVSRGRKCPTRRDPVMYQHARFGATLSVTVGLLVTGCEGGGATHANPPVPTAAVQRTTQAVTSDAIVALPSYKIDPSKVFVAGISSGGFFAVQMHVAHSATFKGAAIYAGGVYHCAQDSVAIALAACGGVGLYQSTLRAVGELPRSTVGGRNDRPGEHLARPTRLSLGRDERYERRPERDERPQHRVSALRRERVPVRQHLPRGPRLGIA